jgi:hypothetical protein
MTPFFRVVARRLAAVLRACCCASVLLLGLGLWCARSARAELGEAALGVGRGLAGFEDLTGESYRVRLNGEPVNVSTALVELSIPEVLARFERHCREKNVAKELGALETALSVPAGEVLGESGALTRSSEREGFIACFARTDAESSLGERLKRFGQTLDLSDVGLLRYAYAKRTEGGRTHVIVAWTDRAFRLEALIAGTRGKDAPGSDLVGGARPIRSVRLLDASVEGAPYGTRIYDSQSNVSDVLAGLDGEMTGRGWTASLGSEPGLEHARAYSRRGRDVLVFAYPSETGSTISMLETRSR